MAKTQTHSGGAPNTTRALGLAVATGIDVIRAVAPAVEQAGYSALWLNNPPGSDALAALAQVAPLAPTLDLGVGVIPLASHPAAEVAAAVHAHHLPQDRLWLGIGSGSGGIAVVRDGLAALQVELQTHLVVAALGPRMARLGGEQADGVLLNWLTPEHALRSVEWIRTAALEAGRPAPRLMAYVRVALGDAAITRLGKEAKNYEAIPHYAAHFERMGCGALATAITGRTAEELQEKLARWDGIVDEVVVRAITAEDTTADVCALVAAAGPAL